MLFLLVLAVAYASLWAVTRRHSSRQRRARLALAAGMAVAGVMHLVTPAPFIQHLPPIVPGRELVVFASGIVEILFGLALIRPARARSLIGLLLAAYFVAVFPGNVYVAVAGIDVVGQPGGIYPWLHLPLQGMFIALALWSTDALSVVPELRRMALRTAA